METNPSVLYVLGFLKIPTYFDDHTFDNLGHVDVGAWRLNMYLPKYPAIITAKMPQKGSVYKLWFDPCGSND